MPRGKKQEVVEEEVEEDFEDDMSDVSEEEDEEEEGEAVVDDKEDVDEEQTTADDEDDEENILEADEDEEEDSDEHAMTIAQKLLMQKKQAVMSQADVYRTYYTQEKQTSPYITKFERAKILSLRAQAIENGAIPFVAIDDSTEDPYSIAQREYDIKKIPYFIVRVLPNQEKEYWRLSDFKSIVPLTSM